MAREARDPWRYYHYGRQTRDIKRLPTPTNTEFFAALSRSDDRGCPARHWGVFADDGTALAQGLFTDAVLPNPLLAIHNPLEDPVELAVYELRR